MNYIEQEWKKLLSEIIEKGEVNRKDDSEVLEILGYNTFVKNPINGFTSQSADSFLQDVRKGFYDVFDYVMAGASIAEYIDGMNDDRVIRCYAHKDGFVYSYPERLLSMRTWDRVWMNYAIVNQLDVILNRLNKNIGTNRAVAHFYNCGLDRDEVDIPCLQFLQATVRNDKLRLHIIFRSNDIFGAWVSNMFLMVYIGLLICDNLKDKHPNIEFEGIDYHVSSAHIYKTDLGMAKRIVER